MNSKRVYARISDEIDEKLRMWAPRLGVDMSQLAGMAIVAGLDSILRAVAPAESLKPEQWAAIFAAMERQGIKPDVNFRIGSEELPDEKNQAR